MQVTCEKGIIDRQCWQVMAETDEGLANIVAKLVGEISPDEQNQVCDAKLCHMAFLLLRCKMIVLNQ